MLNGLMQTILDAETGQRGYLLTGEERYREPYDVSAKQIDGQLAMLGTLYADHPAELARLTLLANHVARKQAEMDMSERLRKSGAEDAWKFVMTTDVGREEMNAIRTQAEVLIVNQFGGGETIMQFDQIDVFRADPSGLISPFCGQTGGDSEVRHRHLAFFKWVAAHYRSADFHRPVHQAQSLDRRFRSQDRSG